MEILLYILIIGFYVIYLIDVIIRVKLLKHYIDKTGDYSGILEIFMGDNNEKKVDDTINKIENIFEGLQKND